MITKDKMLQIRIEQDLLERATALAGVHGWSVSAFVRNVLLRAVQQLEDRVRKDAEWAATLESRAAAAAASPRPPAVDAPEGPLARKMRLAKEVKAKKKANRED